MRFLLLVTCVFQFEARADVLGWAGWSPWTPCSKTCGGGVSQQLRRCLDVKCSGISVRFRVCNAKECDKPSRTARETVCGGETILSKQQCEVVCRSTSSGAKFIWRVGDGTPCQGTTHRSVCANGACQAVGCDDVVGSTLRLDACGVCGGQGDTCEAAHFDWKDSGEYTPCAKDCEEAARLAQLDGGTFDAQYQITVFVCVNTQSGRVVPERMCADREKPKIQRKECPLLVCPSRWLASDWSECVPTCGSGLRQRTVYCVQQQENHSINVLDKYCLAEKKPPSSESCVSKSCGTWDPGAWTSCSVSCGTGTRSRTVNCVGGTDCDKLKKPQVRQACYAGIPCNVIPPQALTMGDEN
uniref:Uncharacterized protein n=1 Tax=Mesorhabditis belari TaxID=2138241 RepID=A0AAF3EJ61_9BILA